MPTQHARHAAAHLHGRRHRVRGEPPRQATCSTPTQRAAAQVWGMVGREGGTRSAGGQQHLKHWVSACRVLAHTGSWRRVSNCGSTGLAHSLHWVSTWSHKAPPQSHTGPQHRATQGWWQLRRHRVRALSTQGHTGHCPHRALSHRAMSTQGHTGHCHTGHCPHRVRALSTQGHSRVTQGQSAATAKQEVGSMAI